MKKNLFGWLVMAAMLVGTGCSTDEVVNDYSPENAIQFGTYVGRDAESRASVIDEAVLQEEAKGFGVYAYYTGQDNFDPVNSSPNFMCNEEVKWNASSGWSYAPTKYWPNNFNDKLTFFAYAPLNDSHITVPTKTSKGNPVLVFSVDNTVANQIDLLYADDNTPDNSKYDYLNITKQSVGGNILFNFKHALSRVAFKVQAMVDKVNGDQNGDNDDASDESAGIHGSTTIAVKQVELIGKFATWGYLNLNGGTWLYGEVTEDKIYSLESANFNEIANNVTVNEEKLNNDQSYMMIIPKYLDGKSDIDSSNDDLKDKVQIRVTYTVKTTDENLLLGYSEITNVITTEPFIFNFKQGEAYTFCLHLGLTSVKIDADVTDWAEQDETAINVPINGN